MIQFYAFKNERLQLWIEKLFDILFEELNTQNIKVVFEGTELDYNDVDEYAQIVLLIHIIPNPHFFSLECILA